MLEYATAMFGLKLQIDGPVHVHLHGDPELLQKILHNTERLLTMSDTFHTDLAANTAAVQGLAAEVSAGLASNAAAIQALKDQIANGTPVTAEDLSTLEGNTAAVQAATQALTDALNPPAPPAP